ncbi:hypothetical protein DFJ73DRAFT_162282 [Zopfochytrium polystomum]|nr:hypothetical protein DFJ73DRAFT_162282 [Zopfochytrium polystomum]
MASAFPPWTFPDPGEPPPSTLPLRGPPQVKRKRSRNNLEDEDIKPDLANLSFQETDGEPSLTFGKLGSFGFNIEETKAASSESYSRPEVGESSNTIVKAVFDGAVRTDPLLEAATPVMKVFPRCRIWDRPHPPTYFHKASSRVAGEINFLESVHLDSGVPRSLLTALVSEAHQEECNRQIRDNYRGNILRVFNTGLDVDHQFLALPGGLLGNELFFMPIRYPSLSDGRAVKPCPWLRPSAVFQTPILQISSSELTPSPSMSRLFAVRSFGAVTLGYVKSESLSTIGSRILQTRAFPSDPLHVAFNPFVPLEAAVVTDDGSIYMMEAGEDGPGTVRTSIACSQDWLDVDNASTSDSRAVWRRLCYGWDPEILLVGGPDSVSSLDLREAQRQLKPFISQDGKSLFCAMNRSPVDPYKLALCSTRHTMIYDCRFSKRPFMQWGIQNILDPPVEVEFFSVRSEESMIAWNSRHAEAIVYSTWKSPTDPAPLDQLGPFTRDTNHHQSPPHTRHRPQRLEPYFRNGMGSLLLIDPLRHTLPFEIGIAPLSTMPRRQLVANFLSGGTHSQARDRMTSDRKWSEYMRNAPPWPPLAGLAVSVRNDRAIVFQAAVDGAVYAQQMDVVASGEVPNAEGSPISPNAEEPDRDEVDAWFAHVEKIAKDHYAQQPHLKRPMRGKDLGCFFQFFKRSLRDPPLNPLFGEDPDAALITAEGAQELQVTIEKAVDFIEQKSRPTTLLEVYKHVTSRVWSYDDAGRPVMEHLRPQAHLLSPAVLDRIVSKLNEKAETSAGTDRNRVDRRFFPRSRSRRVLLWPQKGRLVDGTQR